MRPQFDGPRSQSGLTLLIALILLVMVTMLVVSASRVTVGGLKVVNSMQGRQQGLAAAQSVIEQVISSNFFTQQPATVASTYYGIDVSGDGTDDYVVRISPAPQCVRTMPVEIGAAPTASDLACAGSARLGSARISSYCSDTVWQITAHTQDPVSSAMTTVRQGVAMRVAATDSSTYCK